MEDLLNQKILDVEVCDGEGALKFRTENGNFIFVAEGDCCSESWFSEIINLDFLIGNTVNEVRELNLPQKPDGNCRQEEDSFYGYALITSAGYCTIVFRNSSNGYYGGSCVLSNEFKTDSWRTIGHLSDWTAYENRASSYYKTLKLKVFM